MNTFDNARTYFRTFIEKHFEDYWDKMKEYNSSSYGNYACKAELIQTAREIVHWLQDEFSDLEIGSKFVSPDHLVQTVEDLKKILSSKDRFFTEACEYYAKQGEDLPMPIAEIERMRRETIEACNHFLALVDEERKKDQNQEKESKQSKEIKNEGVQVNINVNAQSQAHAESQSQALAQIPNEAGNDTNEYEIVLKYLFNLNPARVFKLLWHAKFKSLWALGCVLFAIIAFFFGLGYEWGLSCGRKNTDQLYSDSTFVERPAAVVGLALNSAAEEKYIDPNCPTEVQITNDKATQIWNGEVTITMKNGPLYTLLIFNGLSGWTKDIESNYPSFKKSECEVNTGDKIYLKRKNGEIWEINVIKSGISSVTISMFPRNEP